MGIKDKVKALSYLATKRPLALEKPVVLQFPVIDICNSRCQMCRIWEKKHSNDITPERLRRGLKSRLYTEVRAVGINGGEPTLRKDLGLLVEVLFDELPRLKSIALITNAFRAREVMLRVTEVGRVVKARGGSLDVMVSLDGVGDVHDRVRGKPGNFSRAEGVIDFLLGSPLVDNVRVGCTIIKENVYDLADLHDYCRDKGVYIKYRLGIPHQRLYTENLLDPYSLNSADRYHVAEFLEGVITHYEKQPLQQHFYRSLIGQLVHGAPRRAGCDWQHRGATITAKGELLYCAVQSKVLGSIDEGDSEDFYFGAVDHLKEILSSKCDSCAHDYLGVPDRPALLMLTTDRLISRLTGNALWRQQFHGSVLGRWRKHWQFGRRVQRLARVKLTAPAAIASQRSEKKVLICGWYGTETLGDKAILGGVLRALTDSLGPLNVTLAALHPYVSEMTRRQMPELQGMRVVSVEAAVALAAQMELVAFGGGPLMAIDEMADMRAIFRSARAAGVPTLVAGCGVGPLGERWHDRAIADLLKAADVRVFRDEQSRTTAGRLGVNVQHDVVAEDPAFTWLAAQPQPFASTRVVGQRHTLLLGLRDFPHETYARDLSPPARKIAKERYEHAVVTALEQLLDRFPSLNVLPLPMCTNHFGDDDRWYYRRLLTGNERIRSRLDMTLLRGELAPADYCAAFQRASVALTMRFHALVFALGLRVPAVAIDYTLGKGKVHALATRFDVPCQSLEQIEASFIVDEVAARLQGDVSGPPEVEPTFARTLQAALGDLPILRAAATGV